MRESQPHCEASFGANLLSGDDNEREDADDGNDVRYLTLKPNLRCGRCPADRPRLRILLRQVNVNHIRYNVDELNPTT